MAGILRSAAAIVAAGVCAFGQGGADTVLRERVQQFYQLQVEKKYRQAEDFIAKDTKDLFYASAKPDLAGFTIQSLELTDDSHAKVVVRGKVSMFVMGQGMVPVELPTAGTWKLEDGQWVMYIDQNAGVATPFGQMKGSGLQVPTPAKQTGTGAPDVATLVKNFDTASMVGQVVIEPKSVSLDASRPEATAAIVNNLPGGVDLTLLSKTVTAIGISLDKTHLNAGEKASLKVTRKNDVPYNGTVLVDVTQFGIRLELNVTSR
jgi:hypothetical protein